MHEQVKSYLCHDHVLAFLHVLPLGFDDGVQEVQVLHVSAVSGQAVDEVLQDALRDLRAELVVVIEDVLHCLCLLELQRPIKKGVNVFMQSIE